MLHAKSDIYAIVNLWCLTGQVILNLKILLMLYYNTSNNKFPSVRNFDHNIPQSIENIITKCVAKRSEKEISKCFKISLPNLN